MSDPHDPDFAAAWDRVDRLLQERMIAAFCGEEPWRERMRATLAVAFAFLAEDPERARLYVVDSLFAGEPVHKARHLAIERLGDMIDGGSEEAMALARPPIVALGIAGAIWSHSHGLIRDGRVAELPGDLPQLMFFTVLPYLGTAAAHEELERPFSGSL